MIYLNKFNAGSSSQNLLLNECSVQCAPNPIPRSNNNDNETLNTHDPLVNQMSGLTKHWIKLSFGLVEKGKYLLN